MESRRGKPATGSVTSATIRICTRLFCPVLVLAVVALACSSRQPRLDTATVAQELEGLLVDVDQLSLGEVRCDTAVELRAGMAFGCEADIDGQTLHYEGAVVDRSGRFRGGFVEAVIPVEQLHEHLVGVVTDSRIDASVWCSDLTHLVREVNDEISCDVADGKGGKVDMTLQVVSLAGDVSIMDFRPPIGFGLDANAVIFSDPETAIRDTFLDATGQHLAAIDCGASGADDDGESQCEARLGDQTLSYRVSYNRDGSLSSYVPEAAVILVDKVVGQIGAEFRSVGFPVKVDCGDRPLLFLPADAEFLCHVIHEDGRGAVDVRVLDVYGTVTFNQRDIEDSGNIE